MSKYKWHHNMKECFIFHHLDFSILKLERPAKLSSKVGFVCLPDKKTVNYAGVEFTISGWGRTSNRGPRSNVLKVATVFGVSNDDCKVKYLTKGESITNKMLCAFKAGTDTCQGDSGGKYFLSL
jgi:hypothetical protein